MFALSWWGGGCNLLGGQWQANDVMATQAGESTVRRVRKLVAGPL